MTSWVVERDERTTSRSVIAHGGSSLMPSHSQGAERRPERRAERAGTRWVLRALVIGGLAGAAWLLTGSAAYATDSTGPPGSTLDDVATVTGYEPAVDRLLEAAVQSPESSEPNNQRHRAVAEIAAAGPMVTLDQVVHDGAAIDVTTVGALPRSATDSPRTSGGTPDDRALPVSAESVAEPVNELPVDLPPEAPEDSSPAAGDVTTPTGPETGPAAGKTTSDYTRTDREQVGFMPAGKVKVPPRSEVNRYIPAARPEPETVRHLI